MSKTEQERVGKFIEDYLFKRENIALLILLIDIRHKLGENDKLMYHYVRSTGLPFLILGTKADKIAVTKVEQYIEDLKGQLGDEDVSVLPFSSERKIYSQDVWTEIEKQIAVDIEEG